MTDATDAAALARLRALPADEVETLRQALLALATPLARQDFLIGSRRIALSLPTLDTWMHEAQLAHDERDFRAYLAEVQRAATRAEEFRAVLARAETLHQVNVTLLAARLFDALVARDQAAVEQFAHTFAEVVRSLGLSTAPPTH